MLKEFEHIKGVNVKWNEPLAQYTSMSVGGKAAAFAIIDTEETLAAALGFLSEHESGWYLLGDGTNTIFGDAFLEGVVLKLGKGFQGVRLSGEENIYAEAAVPLARTVKYATEHSLSGLEWAAGIPGTVGGAIAGNAGAGYDDICSSIRRLFVMGPDGVRRCLPSSELNYGYRYMNLGNTIVLGVEIELNRGERDTIQNKVREYGKKRSRQPGSVCSSGCIFKNPEGDFAGRLIERAGLKGTKRGGAEISHDHANFIVNSSGASAKDIIALIEYASKKVKETCGIDLEPEVRIVTSLCRGR